MKRSDFFKRLGIGVAVMAIAPMAVKSSEQAEQVLTVDDVEALLEKGVPIHNKHILLDRTLDLNKFDIPVIRACTIENKLGYGVIISKDCVFTYNCLFGSSMIYKEF